ncbi:lachesin-like isoform X1 [Mizuhopecten yessoensis]|uniref:lachesin-like isoform X1 n=1 Tax=Mizuhopecten yessoensis TaxID=6573 RepID=UPI000B458E5A|nr:lachesin-like isoform X1 [Mizuhopecten yessoensis]
MELHKEQGNLIIFMMYLAAHFHSAQTLEPNFDVPIVNVTAIAGKTAILPCSVQALGGHKVAWLDPREKILTLEERRVISDDRISLERPYTNDWNLFIRDVKPSDSGKYMCQINTHPVKIKNIVLYVHEAASIIDELSSFDTTAREGDTVQLICNATGIPPPTVTWYRRPSSTKEAKEVVGLNGEVLVIYNISRYCDDIYECVAFNDISPAASREIRVVVEFAPEIFLPTKRMGQYQGKETILECRVTANPQVYSTWKRNGVEITNNYKYRVEVYEEDKNTITISLRIRQIDKDDYGPYTCKASNSLGTDMEEMLLYEYLPPKTDPATTTTDRTFEQQQPRQNQQNNGGVDSISIHRIDTQPDYHNQGLYPSQQGNGGHTFYASGLVILLALLSIVFDTCR